MMLMMMMMMMMMMMLVVVVVTRDVEHYESGFGFPLYEFCIHWKGGLKLVGDVGGRLHLKVFFFA